VLAASRLGGVFIAASGDKKLLLLTASKVRDCRFGFEDALKLRVDGELGMAGFIPGDLRFNCANFASIWFCIEPGRKIRHFHGK
jgi:hypothetical protein